MVQWIAATETGRKLEFYTFGDEDFSNQADTFLKLFDGVETGMLFKRLIDVGRIKTMDKNSRKKFSLLLKIDSQPGYKPPGVTSSTKQLKLNQS